MLKLDVRTRFTCLTPDQADGDRFWDWVLARMREDLYDEAIADGMPWLVEGDTLIIDNTETPVVVRALQEMGFKVGVS